ncbi:hypothetical protein AHF37_00501 [Paragonimus kellicotti]|nr:hypothetical protein AHF37_00501 [Paragonimus kellicotti]
MGHSIQGEPELGICWPSIRDENAAGFTALPGIHVPRPWDEAVAEVTNLCDPESVCWCDSSLSSSSSRGSPDVAHALNKCAHSNGGICFVKIESVDADPQMGIVEDSKDHLRINRYGRFFQYNRLLLGP